MNRRPHRLDPRKETVRLVIFYKVWEPPTFWNSHIGLGICADNIRRVLSQEGFWVEVFAVQTADHLKDKVAEIQKQAQERGQVPLSHVMICAPWVQTPDLIWLCNTYSDIQFSVVSHSNVAFLQADMDGMKLLKEGIRLQQSAFNFNIGGNTARFTRWMRDAFNVDCALLPNLYDLTGMDRIPERRPWTPDRGTLKIGCFGALRALKNAMTQAGAAIELARAVQADRMEFHISGHSDGDQGILRSIREMYAGEPGIKLVENQWRAWPEFRRHVGSMHMCSQVSFTESCNLVTMDAAYMGVPSVVSESVEWAPQEWRAKPDDVHNVARLGSMVLMDPAAPRAGRGALKQYIMDALPWWRKYLLHREGGRASW